MEKLIQFIETQLKWAKLETETANSNFHSAFGALQFYILEHSLSGDEYVELETLWNETYRPQFEAIVYWGEE